MIGSSVHLPVLTEGDLLFLSVNAASVQEWFIPSQNLLLHIKPSLEILTCKFLVAMDIQKCLSSLEGGTVLAIVCICDEMHVHLTVFIFFSLNWPHS